MQLGKRIFVNGTVRCDAPKQAVGQLIFRSMKWTGRCHAISIFKPFMQLEDEYRAIPTAILYLKAVPRWNGIVSEMNFFSRHTPVLCHL